MLRFSNRLGLRACFSLLLTLTMVILLSGSADMAGRQNKLSHRMMCTCGCAQLLGECNHVGCPNSGGELKTLHADLAAGMTDHEVFVDFEQKYGSEVLASPMLTRFNQAAWVVPPAVLILGLMGALLLIRSWRERRQAAVTSQERRPLTVEQASALAKVRRETGAL